MISKNSIYTSSALFGFLFGLLVFTFFTPSYSIQKKVEFEIQSGSNLNQIIDSLFQRKIIPSKFNMKAASIFYGASNKIKAGLYTIPPGLSYLQLLDLLIEGQPREQKLVTIKEGVWQPHLAGLLKDSLGIDSVRFMELSKNKSFIKSTGIDQKLIEGYLLPETYYFYTGSSAEQVLRKLRSEFDAFFNDSLKRRAKEIGMSTHQILTLASIIDGETNKDSEFKIISGVYHNRLKRGMRLQADPTIQYLIRNRRRYNRIFFKHLEINSKYNTYKYSGLPPGPINNPGKKAILAALYPEHHRYLYFVADGKGGHKFSNSFSQHQRNVTQYRRLRR